MRTWVAVVIGKLVSWFSQTFNFGAGTTWPGEIALKIDPEIIHKIAPKNIVLVVGTNGKTTTALMIKTILEKAGHSVIHNASGANLLNGVVSSILTSPPKAWGVFEVDENSLPIILKSVNPKAIVFLNLFRDQLDRYGEVDVIAEKWQKALKNYDGQLILNADDPFIASLDAKTSLYFGLNDKNLFQKSVEHAMDSQFCPKCGKRLAFDGTYYSHIGIWHCPGCGFKRPTPDISTADYPLPGIYNRYNVLAATTLAKALGLQPDLAGFHPAFGRQEQIGEAKVFLSKNPAGFNESLRAVLTTFVRGPLTNSAKTIQLLLVLNDQIPDGRDVSWIWDVDFEMIPKSVSIGVAGDRAYDLALRLKYAGLKSQIVNLVDGARKAENILATYSAMLEVRKILTGKKIL